MIGAAATPAGSTVRPIVIDNGIVDSPGGAGDGETALGVNVTSGEGCFPCAPAQLVQNSATSSVLQSAPRSDVGVGVFIWDNAFRRIVLVHCKRGLIPICRLPRYNSLSDASWAAIPQAAALEIPGTTESSASVNTSPELHALRNRFAILFVDERGFGLSHPIPCKLWPVQDPSIYREAALRAKVFFTEGLHKHLTRRPPCARRRSPRRHERLGPPRLFGARRAEAGSTYRQSGGAACRRPRKPPESSGVGSNGVVIWGIPV